MTITLRLFSKGEIGILIYFKTGEFMRIQHNIAALNTNRMLNLFNKTINKTLEKLSSGYKINRASDDAAGLAIISDKMRDQIRGLNVAGKNIQGGISLIQTAEGTLNKVHSLLQRQRVVQAGNDIGNNSYQWYRSFS